MSQSYLKIIAGCNGAGKSTYSEAYVSDLVPFDFDKRYLENYNTLIDTEFRGDMANNMTILQFEDAIELAFERRESFCYETNFSESPIIWAQKAKALGYRVELIFFCLNTIDIAHTRVLYRTQDNGHFVPDEVIRERWKNGYKNLNLFFSFFDYVLLVDNSLEDALPCALFELEKDNENSFILRKFDEEIPDYAKRRFPALFELLQ